VKRLSLLIEATACNVLSFSRGDDKAMRADSMARSIMLLAIAVSFNLLMLR